jgi:hypothetical protein
MDLDSIRDSSMNLKSNRCVKIFRDPESEFDIDVFPPIDRNKRFIVVLPGSKVKDNNEEIQGYKIIQDCTDH